MSYGHRRRQAGPPSKARLRSDSWCWHSTSSSGVRPAQIGSPMPRNGRPAAPCSSRKSRQAGMMRAGLRPSSAMSAKHDPLGVLAQLAPEPGDAIGGERHEHGLVAIQPIAQERQGAVEEPLRTVVEQRLVGEPISHGVPLYPQTHLCTAASREAYERTSRARSRERSGSSGSDPASTQRSDTSIASARRAAAERTSPGPTVAVGVKVAQRQHELLAGARTPIVLRLAVRPPPFHLELRRSRGVEALPRSPAPAGRTGASGSARRRGRCRGTAPTSGWPAARAMRPRPSAASSSRRRTGPSRPTPPGTRTTCGGSRSPRPGIHGSRRCEDRRRASRSRMVDSGEM